MCLHLEIWCQKEYIHLVQQEQPFITKTTNFNMIHRSWRRQISMGFSHVTVVRVQWAFIL